jgi:hypothetical protein
MDRKETGQLLLKIDAYPRLGIELGIDHVDQRRSPRKLPSRSGLLSYFSR